MKKEKQMFMLEMTLMVCFFSLKLTTQHKVGPKYRDWNFGVEALSLADPNPLQPVFCLLAPAASQNTSRTASLSSTRVFRGTCHLPAGGLMSGGGIMGITMGRLPCSLLPHMEVDAMLEDSVTPFLDAELLTRSGEPSPRSVEGGIFGNKFSGQGKKVNEAQQRYREKDTVFAS